MLVNVGTIEPAVAGATRPTSPNVDQLSVVRIGLHYLPYRHTFNMNITLHVCEGLEAIWAYTACALLA